MFWAADSNGRLASMTNVPRVFRDLATGSEQGLTGNARPQVIAGVHALLRSVLQSKGAGSTSCRITQAGGLSARIKIDASPALSITDGSFAGYIGSIDLVADEPSPQDRPVDEALARVVLLDAVADRLIRARVLAVGAGEGHLVKILDLALLSVGDRLAQSGDA